MSIRRIESAYAYFIDRKMSGTEMAVLQALAYCANDKTEKCFPSVATLSKMTHLSNGTVERTCKSLRAMKVIDWKTGGQVNKMNISNSYSFLFPIAKMTTRRERYEQATQEISGGTITAKEWGAQAAGEVIPQLLEEGTPTVREGGTPTEDPQYPHCEGTVPLQKTPGTLTVREGVPLQWGSNTECKFKSNSQIKPESKSDTTPPFVFDLGDECVFKKVNESDSREKDPRMKNASIEELLNSGDDENIIDAIMRICGVSDEYNRNVFRKYLREFKAVNHKPAMRGIVEELLSEIKQGMASSIENRARCLTGKFKKALKAINERPPQPNSQAKQA